MRTEYPLLHTPIPETFARHGDMPQGDGRHGGDVKVSGRRRRLMIAEDEPSHWDEDRWDEEFARFYESHGKFHDYNAGSDEWDHSITLATNQFTDLTWEEFRQIYLPTFPPPNNLLHNAIENEQYRHDAWWLKHMTNWTIPESMNWHDLGCVTPIKNQAQCGSCWAFASTGAIEGAICAKTGKLVSLSEQELVDCALTTDGCRGGLMDNAFKWVVDNGICAEDAYPYSAKFGSCHREACQSVATIKGFLDLPPKNAKALEAAIAHYGPVAVGVEADRAAFQFYNKGVLNVKCGKHINHAILITGYGHDAATNESYWLAKNSWGQTWGDKGYLKISRDRHAIRGECGILLIPSLPLVEVNFD